MSAASTLLSAVENGLSQTAHLGYSSAAAAEDAYEAFVWWRLVQVAKALGWTATMKDINGPVTNHFRFRTGPGWIYSSTPFTFAELIHPHWPTLEIHLGIRIEGRSGVEHEFDVVAITKAGADLARSTHGNPLWSDVAAHAECKLYAGKIGLGLARGLWGLSADCRLRRRGGLVTNGPASDSAKTLLNKHGVYYRPQTLPYNVADLHHALTWRLTWFLRDQGFPI